ncbi:uncharacterized protein [Nicotiana sylvestris]|uniref:uncharacterized protein n=1 Tax=Nicotiana sylvestris TaxID=4096 RepID=UPI00388C9DE6
MYSEDQEVEKRKFDIKVKPKMPFSWYSLKVEDNPKAKESKVKATTSTGQSKEPVEVVTSSQPPTAIPEPTSRPSISTPPNIPASSAYPLTAYRLNQTLSTEQWKTLKELSKYTKKLNKTWASKESVKEFRGEVEKMKTTDHLHLEVLLHDQPPAAQIEQVPENEIERAPKRRRMIPQVDDLEIELEETEGVASGQPQAPGTDDSGAQPQDPVLSKDPTQSKEPILPQDPMQTEDP